MTLLAVVRHGVTDWNLEGRIQGRRDTPLSEAGRTLLAGRRIPEEWSDYDRLCSPLRRCRETADILFGPDAPYATDPRLMELNWGGWEGRRREELRGDPATGFLEQEARGLDLRPPGGESPRELQQRVRSLLAEIAARGRPTLAVTHKGVIRGLLCLATGWDMLGRPPAKLDWTAA
ncbi:MAG: histidine phosphatase family protein, partial [Alphaproteobacteria bacterium]